MEKNNTVIYTHWNGAITDGVIGAFLPHGRVLLVSIDENGNTIEKKVFACRCEVV